MTDEFAGHETNPNIQPIEQRGKFGDRRFQKPTPPVPRGFRTAFPKDFLGAYHQGTMNYTYKGVSCLKDPIDLALYMKLIWEKKPASIIEIGSFRGGSALFYYDLCRMYGLETEIVTADFRAIQEQDDPHIKFYQADAMRLEESALHAALETLPRPWLVIEDSAHTGDVCYAVLMYFKDRLRTGEVLIMEDGVIEDQDANPQYRGGPNLAINRLFTEHPTSFRVMTEFTDFFGVNATFNPNGYLEKL